MNSKGFEFYSLFEITETLLLTFVKEATARPASQRAAANCGLRYRR